MAAPTRIISLDLGTQTVALAEFKAKPDGGLVLTNYRSTELLADPAADATRQAQARIAVGEMAQAMSLKGLPVNYAVASQSVFTRFVPLPSVAHDQVEQIVTFEAQQNVPYPINEVVWDYQLVETVDASQVAVVIVAIKSDLLDDINSSVEASKLKTAVVDISPMALYNAFRYNYGNEPGCSLVIDIGARTTNLVFVEPKKVFSRSIPTGGNTITAAIAKDFNEPFGAAEERKKRDGFVSLGGAYADPDDPDAARVSKITRNTMTRLHAEITRSISFYRSQQGGAQPARVYLAGSTASMPYMREFFQEKFTVPVDYFNPLRNVAVGPNLNVEAIGQKAHTMGALVGLALRDVASCPMELNLRPASVIARERATRQKPALILASLGILAGLAAGWLYFSKAAEATAAVTSQLEPKVAQLKSVEANLKTTQAQIKEHQDAVKNTLQTVTERDYWASVLGDIGSRLPKEFVWITEFTPENVKAAAPAPEPAKGKNAPKGGKNQPPPEPEVRTEIMIRGLYLSNPRDAAVVDDFVAKLGESQLYTVDKSRLEREVPSDTKWAFDYSFPLVLKQNINLPAPKTQP